MRQEKRKKEVRARTYVSDTYMRYTTVQQVATETERTTYYPEKIEEENNNTRYQVDTGQVSGMYEYVPLVLYVCTWYCLSGTRCNVHFLGHLTWKRKTSTLTLVNLYTNP